MSDSEILDGAIAERPREVSEHPLLSAIYDRHDALVDRYAVGDGRSLELAFGRHPHPDADVGVEAYHENSVDAVGIEATTADARRLPFRDDSFDTVIGRRFLHHVPAEDRERIVAEVERVLAPHGRFVVLEGTPGAYRRLTKRLAFRLGVLGEDTDEYGHLSVEEVRELLADNGFDLVEVRPLGSPLMPFSISTAEWSARLAPLYDRTNWIRWWTLAVATPRGEAGSAGADVRRSTAEPAERRVVRPNNDTAK